MPRRPKRMEERKFPKTTGIRAEGKCGHEFDTRIPLDQFGGQFRTPENIASVDHLIKRQQDELKKHTCPTCHALDVTEIHQQSEYALTQWLGVDPLPVLKGSKREIGFAMEVRHNALIRMLANRRASGMSLLGESRFVQAFILDAVNAKWGRVPEDAPASPDMIALVKGAESLERMGFYSLTFWSRFFQETTGAQVLSGWLVYRHAMLETMNLFYVETDASFWIRQQKGNERYLQPRSGVSVASHNAFAESLAADIVAHAAVWEERVEAYAAFRAMLSDHGTVESQALAHSESETPLKDMLEQMSVMRALVGPDRSMYTPF